MRRSTIIAIALIIAIGIPLIPLAVILWPSPQTQVPDQPQQSASIFLKGNEAIDSYFIEDLGDGLSWTTAYTLAYISVDGSYANSSIWIKDSTRYLIIKNCSVMHGGTEYNGGAGIIIENSTHVKIANTSVMYNGGWGILLNNSQECIVCDNIVKENGKDGIALRGSQNCSILQNSVSSSEIDGISLYDSTNCSIINNSPATNDEDGIFLRNSANCSIINNSASRNGNDGIHLYDSANCSIAENELLNASKAGIELYHSNCSDIRNNTVDGLTIGIYLANSHANNFVGNIMSGVGFSFQGLNNFTLIDSSNVVNGLPVFYYENKTRLNLAALTDVGQLVLVNCNDSSILELDIKHASQGLALISCKNNTISGNTFADNGLEGIYLYNSPNNTLIENNVSSNGEKSWGLHYLGQGIRIEMSNYCVIINNIIGDNYEYGLRLWNSHYCTITGCDISNSEDGIYSWSCQENVIQSNSIYANINGIRIGYSNTNTIIGNSFVDNKYYAIQLERSDNNLISGNSLPTGQCIYQDEYCSGNSGDDIQGHACPVPPPGWLVEFLIMLPIMAVLIAFQYFVGKKARKMARKRKERFLEARKTLDPAVREFYRTHHGFDPFDARKERWGVVSHFEETFPLNNDPSLLAADISVSARVDFFSDGRSLNRIIFRRGKQEASVTCTHTVIYEGPADEAVGLSSDLEPGSTIMALPKVNSRNPPESNSNAPPPVNSPGDHLPPEQSSTPVARQIEAGNGRPADLLPWEHFAALKSYVAAIAEEGIGNLLANSFCSDEDDQYNQVTGFNTAMQTQILNALTRIGPKHVTAMILTRMLESIVSTEDRLKWFKLRFPVMDKYYHIRYHLRNTPDLQAIFVGAVERWGCAHIPEEILYCLADSPLLSIMAAGIISQLPYPRILKKLKLKARQVVEQPFR